MKEFITKIKIGEIYKHPSQREFLELFAPGLILKRKNKICVFRNKVK